VSRTPEAQAHVELAPSGGVPQGPSEANDQRLRPYASDDALRRSQGLDQVANQGWVAYFNCHCRCHAPRVAAGEARTSHSRQKRSAVKGRPQRTPGLDRHPRRSTATRRLLAAPQDGGNPYARELELEFSCLVAAERVSLAVSPGDPVRDREPCRASRAPASSRERAGAPCLSAPRAQPPTGSPGGCRAGVGQRGGEAARGKIRPHRVSQLALTSQGGARELEASNRPAAGMNATCSTM
jgi:hypothetical protein